MEPAGPAPAGETTHETPDDDDDDQEDDDQEEDTGDTNSTPSDFNLSDITDAMSDPSINDAIIKYLKQNKKNKKKNPEIALEEAINKLNTIAHASSTVRSAGKFTDSMVKDVFDLRNRGGGSSKSRRRKTKRRKTRRKTKRNRSRN